MPTDLAAHFRALSRPHWANLQHADRLPLRLADLQQLRGHNEPVSLAEVEEVYLPLSRLLSLHVDHRRSLLHSSQTFLHESPVQVPFIIGVAGSVAVGKSTTSRLLQALLAAAPPYPKVSLLTTDGFLHANATLQARGLMHRKGFPESYDIRALLACLSAIKAGSPRVQAPLYSHHIYDIVPGGQVSIEAPDILIVEGINVLQVGHAGKRQPRLFVSDYFDFSIYVDAPTALIKAWFAQRFADFAAAARDDKAAYFYRFRDMTPQALQAYADKVWTEVNEVNLLRNILPFSQRARLILQKGAQHQVEHIWLRRH